MKQLQVALDERLHKRLKRVAADRAESLGNLLREAVTTFVEHHEQSQNQDHGEEGKQP
ncbi:MAG: hypothetical protein JW751_13890 [Polyangiaceae bacterium]|nr:hypothetical protein [Polyangiaceae bacterium]